jgi:hypothetical protein
MKRLFLTCMLLAALVAGCSRNHYNVPIENIADNVRVLGVVPIIVDATSEIRHPQKDQLVPLVAELNRRYEGQLVRKLKETGNFYTIALLDGEPQEIFGKLYSRRERRDDAAIQYNKYFWKSDEVRSYLQKNNLDAVMLLVVSGLTKSDKVTSALQLKSMTSEYNYLIMTAQVVDANGTILWEYPNFRQQMLSFDPLMNLEYPDFSEADANLTSSANVKFKTIDGIRRTLEVKRKDWLLRETQEPEIYGRQFDQIVTLLKYDPDKEKKAPAPVAEAQKPVQAAPQPAKAPEAKPAAAAPALQGPAAPAPAPEKPAAPSDEIVPAKGSTL